MTRAYARTAAAAFLVVTAYSVTTKVAGDRLADDWLHSLLHVVSAAVAIHVGWRARSARLARAFALAVGGGYTVLGVLGWFVPGFFMDSAAALPLDPAANVFHLTLGIPGLALVAAEARGAPPAG